MVSRLCEFILVFGWSRLLTSYSERITALQGGLTDIKSTTDNIEEELVLLISAHEVEIMENERNDIRRWLRFEGIEYEARYQEALSQRQAATGSWILNSRSFLEWSLNPSTSMWLYGIGEMPLP
jgi:hypothetical protein